MAGPMGVLDVTYLAEEDLSNSQWCAVVVGAADDGLVLPAGANAGDVIGILQDTPADAQQGHVIASRATPVGRLGLGQRLLRQ